MAEHTPTPWVRKKHGDHFRIVNAKQEMTVLRSYGDSLGDETDTDFAILAVNNHKALVEALDKLIKSAHPSKLLPPEAEEYVFSMTALADAGAVLAQATGAPEAGDPK